MKLPLFVGPGMDPGAVDSVVYKAPLELTAPRSRGNAKPRQMTIPLVLFPRQTSPADPCFCCTPLPAPMPALAAGPRPRRLTPPPPQAPTPAQCSLSSVQDLARFSAEIPARKLATPLRGMLEAFQSLLFKKSLFGSVSYDRPLLASMDMKCWMRAFLWCVAWTSTSY